MSKKGIRAPILALFLLSLGGWVLHFRMHPPSQEAANLIPLVFTSLGVVVLPVMFSLRSTVRWAYLINIAAVIVGTISMAHESIETWTGPVSLYRIIFESTLADIVILLAKLPLGQAILGRYRTPSAETERAED
jgi:hypothetical protein